MTTLKPLLFEAVFVGLAAAGWVWGIDAARWSLHALVWALLLPAALVCAFSARLQARMAARPRYSQAARLGNRIAYLVALATLLWHGAWVSGAALAVVVLCLFVTSSAVARLRAQRAAS